MSTICVVLDTNVILSGLTYPSSTPGNVMRAWRSGALNVILSEFILDELRRVLPRLQYRHLLSHAEMDDLVELLRFQAELVIPDELLAIAVRAPDDLKVLGTFVAAQRLFQTDYLISGDKDLLVLAAQFPILSPAEFWARHG